MTRRSWASTSSDRFFLGALLFISVATPTAYLVRPWLTLYRLAFMLAAIVTVPLIVKRYRQRQVSRRPLGPRTRVVFVTAMVMVTYMVLIDLVRNDPVQGVKDFLIRLTVVGLIPLCAALRTSLWWRVRVLLLVSIVPIAVGAMQLLSPDIRIESLTPEGSLIGFYSSDPSLGSYVESTGRIVGTSGTNAIWFAMYLGVIAIAGFAAWRRGVGRWTALVALMAVALAPFTFTRSLIFGLVPSAVIGLVVAMPNLKRAVTTLAVGAAIVLMTVFLLVPAISSLNDRVSRIDDTQTIVKLRSNLYGARYTIEHSPLVGIRHEDLYTSLAASFDPTDFSGTITIERLQTNHNQFGFMMRFYGLIGLGLMLWLVLATFRLIMVIQDRWAKALMAGVFIFILQYSVLHNVYMYNVPVFWLLLVGVERESAEAPQPRFLAVGPRRASRSTVRRRVQDTAQTQRETLESD